MTFLFACLSSVGEILTYDPASPLTFCSGLFLWLFVGFLCVYTLLLHRSRLRLLFVVAFSYFFYYKSGGWCFLLLAAVTLSDFLIALRIDREHDCRRRKAWVTLSISLDLLLLAYFKYTNFLFASFCSLFGHEFSPFDIVLPVGISFFTFQSLSYTIDVYRRQISSLRSFSDYAFFVSFFPQLVAGPIVKARDFCPQIRQKVFVSEEMMSRGLFLILTGLIKKTIVSDYLSVNFVDRVFECPQLYSGIENLLAMYGYAIQIYCDFSGYSDMAIGIALLLGFRLGENFRAPFKATSITDFWRRWHISLSTWLRDYVYISLGGNRKGKVRRSLNLFATMLLGGLWHGAAWNFVLWGAMHGLALCAHKWWAENKPQVLPVGPQVRRWLSIILTFHFVCITFVFFRAESVATATDLLVRATDLSSWNAIPAVAKAYWPVLALGLAAFVSQLLPNSINLQATQMLQRAPVTLKALTVVVVIFAVIMMQGTEIRPFIYFQF